MGKSKRQIIRQEMKELRNGLDIFAIEELSDKVFENFLKLNLKDKTTFFIYNSFGSEVQTQKIIKHIFDNNKRVYLPRVEGDIMKSIAVDEKSEFIKSKFGILEPMGKSDDIDDFVAIMPCLAVDKLGNRLGYGGGYYDKFLQNKSALKITLCYDFQLLDELETEDLDVPVDLIITDKRILSLEYKNEKEK